MCGNIFDNTKRYNSFLDEWELDTDTCEQCVHKKILEDCTNSIIDYSVQS